MNFGTQLPASVLHTGLEVYIFLDLCEGLEPTAAGHLAQIPRGLLQRLVQQQEALQDLPQVKAYTDLMQRACDIVAAQCQGTQLMVCPQDLTEVAKALVRGVRLLMWFLRANQLLHNLSKVRAG